MSIFSTFARGQSVPLENEGQLPDFRYGDLVEKVTGDYRGPGIVRGIAVLDNGKVRYLVAHMLANGSGELLHVYGAWNLRHR